MTLRTSLPPRPLLGPQCRLDPTHPRQMPQPYNGQVASARGSAESAAPQLGGEATAAGGSRPEQHEELTMTTPGRSRSANRRSAGRSRSRLERIRGRYPPCSGEPVSSPNRGHATHSTAASVQPSAIRSLRTPLGSDGFDLVLRIAAVAGREPGAIVHTELTALATAWTDARLSCTGNAGCLGGGLRRGLIGLGDGR